MIDNKEEQSEVIDRDFDLHAEKTKAEKRAVISISVTQEEKRRISVEALKDYSTTVSDLIRSRMFIKTEDKAEQEKESKSSEEEIDIYKEIVQQLKSEIEDLSGENLSLKIEIKETQSLKENGSLIESHSLSKENILFLEFIESENEKSIVQKIKEYRSNIFENSTPEKREDFHDIEKFAKMIFLRGLMRTYNNGHLREDTGLKISEVKSTAQIEEIDYDFDV